MTNSADLIGAGQAPAAEGDEPGERDPFASIAGRALGGEEPIALEAELLCNLARRVGAERACLADAAGSTGRMCVRHEIVQGRSVGAGLDRCLGEPRSWGEEQSRPQRIENAAEDPRLVGLAPLGALRDRSALALPLWRDGVLRRLLVLVLREPADDFVCDLAQQAGELALELEARAMSDRALRARAESSITKVV